MNIFERKDIQEYINQNSEKGYDTLLELAVYYTEDFCPTYIFEFDDYEKCAEKLLDLMYDRPCLRIEIALIGRCDGENQTCFILNEIKLKGGEEYDTNLSYKGQVAKYSQPDPLDEDEFEDKGEQDNEN